MHVTLLLAAASAAFLATADPAPAQQPLSADVGTITMTYQAVDSSAAVVLEDYADYGAAVIERFFDQRFSDPVTIRILPDRESFDAYAAKNWGLQQTQCWMVGAAGTTEMVLLSTRHWKPECDHDPEDAGHVRNLVVHELVHVFHMQSNPTDEFVGAEEVGWFVEGLATYVSGQLESSHADRAREAVETGETPDRLVDAWSGPYRYGVAGSLAAFLDDQIGRTAFTELLTATTQAELLEPTGMSEQQFLAAWMKWVLSDASQ
jgi:hypothetical protein